MSNAIFPALPGLKWGIIRAPIWSTKILKSASGRELRAAYYSYPLWKYSLSYEVLRANALEELQTLVGFFNARQGSFDTFLYEDPDDKAVTDQAFGITSPSQAQYQLVRDFGGFVEPVLAPKLNGVGEPIIKIGSTTLVKNTDYTLGSTGLVTLLTSAAGGQPLTWTGSFYFRCRFLHDSTEFEQFMKRLWNAKKIEFQSVKS